MNKKISVVLREAKTLIDTPDTWTQGVYEDTLNGKQCYCSIGAIKAVPDITEDEELFAIQCLTLAVNNPYVSVIDFNDNSFHPQVMALWDKAIAQADKEGL